jgi:hypothetical protein
MSVKARSLHMTLGMRTLLIVLLVTLVGSTNAFGGRYVIDGYWRSIEGIVQDERGTPLPGVTVVVLAQGVKRGKAVTDARGRYRIRGLEQGHYDLELSLGRTKIRQRIIVRADVSPTLIDMTVRLAGPFIDTTDAANETLFTTQDLRNLP